MKTMLLWKALLSILLVSVLISCSDDDNDPDKCLDISRPVVTEMRTVSAFDRILLEGIGTVLLTQGPLEPIRIETHQEVLTLLETEVVGGELQISLRDCLNGMIDRLDIFVSTPDIERLQVDGVGTFVAQNDLDLDRLEVVLNGVGDVFLKGICEELDVSSAGVGNVQAFDLSTQICSVNISGTGNAEVTVDSLLDVTIAGAGNVYYKGDPEINLTVSGTGSLIDSN